MTLFKKIRGLIDLLPFILFILTFSGFSIYFMFRYATWLGIIGCIITLIYIYLSIFSKIVEEYPMQIIILYMAMHIIILEFAYLETGIQMCERFFGAIFGSNELP